MCFLFYLQLIFIDYPEIILYTYNKKGGYLLNIRVLIMRILAVLCVLGAVGLLVYEYIYTGKIDFGNNKLVKLLGAVTGGIALFYKSFAVADVVNQNDAHIEKEFYSMTNGIFKEEDKKAKEIFKKGFVYYSLDKNDKAEKLFNKALQTAETYKVKAIITAMLGKIFIEKCDYETAETLLKNALAIDKSCCKAWSFYLDLCLETKNLQKTEIVGEEALMYCKEDPCVYSKIGTSYIYRAEYEKALRVFKAAKQYSPANAVNSINLAVAYAGVGNEKEAMIAFEDAKILKYDNCGPALEMIQGLLKKAEMKRVKYTGKFELSLEGCKFISDCTAEEVLEGLRSVWDGEYDFAILTPPEAVGDVLFIQVANEDNEALLQMSVGPNGSGVLYEKCCSYEEAETIFIDFINEKKTPGIVSFKQTEFM